MNLVLKTPPAIEPLEVQEIKTFLRLDDVTDTSEDGYLSAIITAAREYCEAFQNRAYITQTWQMSFDYWPSRVIELPRGNLQTIDAVTYRNSAGIETTLTETEQYVVSTRGVSGRLSPPYAQHWPSFVPFPLDAVVIAFTCGHGDTVESVPQKAKQAIKLLVSHWYENRTPLSDTGKAPGEIAFAVSALLWQDRIVPV